jgi:hypothetical protein
MAATPLAMAFTPWSIQSVGNWRRTITNACFRRNPK